MDNIRALKYAFMAMVGLMVVAIIMVWSSQGHQVAIANSGRDSDHVFLDDEPTLCYETNDTEIDNWGASFPKIYFITPTYPRREQIPELTRLGQTLMHIRNLHWIVANDDKKCNPLIVKFLIKFGIPLTIMASPMPRVYHKNDKSLIPRGVANRRAALGWIQKNAESGVFYFGDDDNTFDLELFEEIRYTKKVSMFPVGLIGEFAVSSPVVKEGKVVGFFDSWPANRKFSVDMAGFAVSVEYLQKRPGATMPFKAGYEEDMFLRSLGLRMDDIEPLADNCTKILVWHTQTTKKVPPTLRLNNDQTGTSLDKLLIGMANYGIASSNHMNGIHAFYTRGHNRTTV